MYRQKLSDAILIIAIYYRESVLHMIVAYSGKFSRHEKPRKFCERMKQANFQF